MQIWPLCSAPCLTPLCILPCTDPSTRPHIQESDMQGTCRLNFWYYYFPFWIFTLWNVVPSRPFAPCSWHDPSSVSRCVGLFLSIYKYSLSVLMCPLKNNLVEPLFWPSWSELPYLYSDLFASNLQPPKPAQPLLQYLHAFIFCYFSVNYTVISKSLIVDAIFLQISFT
jgi:hypothetical protein